MNRYTTQHLASLCGVRPATLMAWAGGKIPDPYRDEKGERYWTDDHLTAAKAWIAKRDSGALSLRPFARFKETEKWVNGRLGSQEMPPQYVVAGNIVREMVESGLLTLTLDHRDWVPTSRLYARYVETWMNEWVNAPRHTIYRAPFRKPKYTKMQHRLDRDGVKPDPLPEGLLTPGEFGKVALAFLWKCPAVRRRIPADAPDARPGPVPGIGELGGTLSIRTPAESFGGKSIGVRGCDRRKPRTDSVEIPCNPSEKSPVVSE